MARMNSDEPKINGATKKRIATSPADHVVLTDAQGNSRALQVQGHFSEPLNWRGAAEDRQTTVGPLLEGAVFRQCLAWQRPAGRRRP